MTHALQALRINWISEEFSLVPNTLVRVLLPNKTEVDLCIEELYIIANDKDDHTLVAPFLDSSVKSDIRDAFLAGSLCVHAVTPDKKVIASRIEKVLRHFTPSKDIFRIVSEGISVDVTGDHSLFRYKEEGIEPVEASKLVVGDAIVQVLGDTVYHTVVSEIKVLPSIQFTYDLSIPGLENFVLSNGILAHNSYSIGGISLDLDRSSKYEGAYQAAADQFDKQLEKAKLTINIVKGLQQPRFGVGIRSAFGPFVGRGVLSPRKFV
jgi:hypothetical protein